ncbi:GNAT family N-acetyltransferase [Streptomyces sp. NPDC046821]|uniref:GNAT family N-acetyltransferase n=1 Tax=Streptomyces sp. NPDC046821 TaxID=3154702 RepID=UPI0033C588E8
MTERTVYLDPDPQDWSSRKIRVQPSRWYATIELDRDGYVDAARSQGYDPELPDAYTEAVDRARIAAIDRIRYEGRRDAFSWSNDPRWVNMFVPFPHVETTVEALRVAELDQDYGMLQELADRLALPIDDWLAPGERELFRGVDFDPPPHAFLRFLRATAKRHGVRLNARATAGSLWVRPTLSPLQKQIRERLPDQYPGWVDRWSGYVEPDDAATRPWVGSRSQDLSRGATRVQFREVTTPRNDECPCGMRLIDLGDENNEHASHHTAWAFGVRAPKNLDWWSDLAVVTTQSPIAWRRLAHRVARMPQKEDHYDFNSWSHLGEPEVTPDNMRAYLLQANGHVIGYLSAHDTSEHRWWDLLEESQEHDEDNTLRPRIDLIWVADVYRRQGVGATLLEALAEDFGCQIADVSWSTPVSSPGLRLARRVSPEGIWIS